MNNNATLIIKKSLIACTCIIFPTFLTSCKSTPGRIGQESVETTFYANDVTAKGSKKRIVVGEHGGYWEYNEEVKETGCKIDVELEVSDVFCLNKWSCEEAQFPDTGSAAPYKCTCTIGWTYHSVKGDSSPPMNWNIHFVANGNVTVMENSFATLGGMSHSTAEALSSAKLTCNNIVLKSEQLSEKVESDISPPLHSGLLNINTQPNGILPAGSTSIELVAELSASVKARAGAQAGLLCFLSPAESRATSRASIVMKSLRFTSFNRVME